MQSFKFGSKEFSLQQIMTSIDLRAYVSGFFETEDNPAV
jgi:hypothetical protein